jgi:fumarate reductase subunit C
VALSALVAGLVFLAKKNWKMFGASLTVLLSGLVSGALVFVSGSDTERARLIETVRNFTAPLTAPSLIEHPFGVIYDALRVWSPMLNPLLMVLAIVGVVLLVRERASNYKVFMLSWMAVAGIGTFFAVTLNTEIWRIWYLQPLWLLGATGIRGLLQMGDSIWNEQASYLVAARTALIISIAGIAVFLLDPAVGSVIFYVAALSVIVIHLRGQRANARTILASAFILFVLVFFLNHALRSLYPLILNPHNYLEH